MSDVREKGKQQMSDDHLEQNQAVQMSDKSVRVGIASTSANPSVGAT